MTSFKSISRLIAIAALLFTANLYAAADYYLKIDGVKGESARIVRCPDGACVIDNLAPGSFSITVCDDKGNPITTNNFKLTVQFNPKEYTVTKSAVRESPTKASTGGTGITTATSEIVSPRDPASGQATGKRQHKPVTFVKEWDAATPKLMMKTPTGEDHNDVARWTLEVRVQRIEMK
ncbi:MAG TPA: type VI secretion system tube protein Hcp [Saprospiraceae bacterium]|nr:type VI secretion system tube protein Hcp [Saprospiraceae bacterium]